MVSRRSDPEKVTHSESPNSDFKDHIIFEYGEAETERLNQLLSKVKRVAPNGATDWPNPTGFHWDIESLPHQKRVFLRRNSDQFRVLEIPSRARLVITPESCPDFILTSYHLLQPSFYRIPLAELLKAHSAIQLEPFLVYPVIEGKDAGLAQFLDCLVECYEVEDQYFGWCYHPLTGSCFHGPLNWFNDHASPDRIESIEKLCFDPVTKKLVGSGARIPHFVVAESDFKLLGFFKSVGDPLDVEASERKIRVWNDKIRQPISLR